jgi:hypothetical protein
MPGHSAIYLPTLLLFKLRDRNSHPQDRNKHPQDRNNDQRDRNNY